MFATFLNHVQQYVYVVDPDLVYALWIAGLTINEVVAELTGD